jgi:hypothetical protein
VESRPNATACNTFGWTPVVSIKKISPNSQRLLTRCFAGIGMQINAMYIYQMSQKATTKRMNHPSPHGSQLFGIVDSLHEAARFRSLSLINQRNSSPPRVCGCVTKDQWSNRFARSLVFIRAIQGDPLSTFSFDERISWANKRDTTRKEDKVYSLLGIFGSRKRLMNLERKSQKVNLTHKSSLHITVANY